MKQLFLITFVISVLCMPALPARAAGAPKKLTCCEEAKAKDKECSHKCCIAAHKKGESCTRCNPNKEDVVKKEPKKAEKSKKS